MSLTLLVDAAFSDFRTAYPELKPVPLPLQDASQMTQMRHEDGLEILLDGSAKLAPSVSIAPELSVASHRPAVALWVVRLDDVVHAREQCDFGVSVKGGKAKHSNLTGGAAAHCAGEILFHSNGVVVVNGDSGRYGPRTVEEMNAVVIAFARSGYETWTTGWNADDDKPVPFFVANLKRVSA